MMGKGNLYSLPVGFAKKPLADDPEPYSTLTVDADENGLRCE